MSERPYEDLVFGVQALRQVVDRDARALCGALGVAAHHLPHQLGNVRRVLRDIEVRHLLADEVGLGKTIQALMIANALRLQRPGLRVLIVVPNELMAQWRDECLARGHIVTIDEDDEREVSIDLDEDVRLAWPKKIGVPSEIDPQRYDLLIVDEFHSLTRTLKQRILSTAADFSHLLLISATPPFHDPQRLGELMRMLEPERATTLAPDEAETDQLQKRLLTSEAFAADLLGMDEDAEMFWGSLGGAPPVEERPAAVSQAFCSLRRIIRARRGDFSEYMPPRKHESIVVEPVSAEVSRQRLMWEYFGHLGTMTREFDLDLLAQRVIRSPASLQQRVTYLRGHGHERAGLLSQVAPLLGRDNGDSRLDALCDLLTDIWHEDPDAKILVAAGDNLTVDDLAKRLPKLLGEIGPLDEPRVLEIARVRNQPKDIAEKVSDRDEIQDHVGAFTVGSANLLLAADIAKQGLNLQKTRHIVLYSIPWDPQEIEQWIGRVDRIGNTAVQREGQRELLPIVVYTISQRGLVDERIVQVMEATAVLERSISLDSQAVQVVRESIRAAALEGSGGDWRQLLKAAADLSGGEIEDLDAPLLQHLPWSAEASKALCARLDAQEPLQPVLMGAAWATGLRGREETLLRWLKSMSITNEYDVRGPREKTGGLRTIGNKLVERPDAQFWDRYIIKTRVQLSSDRITHAQRPVYFLALRRELSQPPVRVFLWRETEPNPVYFLDHGSPLLDDLVSGWLEQGRRGTELFQILMTRRHPAHRAMRGNYVSLVVGDVDPARGLGDLSMILAGVAAREGAPPVSELSRDPKLRAARLADERFLRLQLARQLCCAGEVITSQGSQPLAEEQLWSLLDPFAGGREDKIARSGHLDKAPQWVMAGAAGSRGRLLERAARAARQRWSAALPKLEAAIERRLYLLSIAERDALQLAETERTERLRREAAAFARARAEARRRWLRVVPENLLGAEVELYRSAVVQVMGLRAD